MKHKRKGIKSPVGKFALPPRVSRHGKLLIEAFTRHTEEQVAARRANVLRAINPTTSGGKKNGTPKKGS